MNCNTTHYRANSSSVPGDPTIAPALDAAVAGLREKDRQAIVLRFYEGRNLREVGLALGASEAAAEKRVSRALEKLRKFFAKRGVVSTTAILAGAMAAHSVQAAPAGLAISAAALVKGSTATASILTLVKGTLKLMTMAKIKAAVLIGAAIVAAGGTTAVISRAVAQESSVDDSAWARMDTRTLNSLPPAFVLRPTHFAEPVSGFGGGMTKAGNRLLGRAISFDTLMSLAYNVDLSLVVSPADKPSGLYDVLVTAPDAAGERLQAEIKRQLGYVAHREARTTDVWLLVLKQAGAPGLRPSQGGNGGGGGSSSSRASAGAAVRTRTITAQNQPISGLIRNLQGYLDRPVIDRTGLTGKFDVSLKVTAAGDTSDRDAVVQALPAQLGLELVPGREPVDTLVVEKAK